MNVASLKLCKELHELSGWQTLRKWVVKDNGLGDRTTGTIEPSHREYLEVVDSADDTAPAYGLGYLLRKLPLAVDGANLILMTDGLEDPEWCAYYDKVPVTLKSYYNSTPEDAAAKLAIELFKQGVLTRDGDGQA